MRYYLPNCSHIVSLLQTTLDETGPDGTTLYQFDGSSDSFVSFSDELTFEPTRGFTFASWVSQESGNDG